LVRSEPARRSSEQRDLECPTLGVGGVRESLVEHIADQIAERREWQRCIVLTRAGHRDAVTGSESILHADPPQGRLADPCFSLQQEIMGTVGEHTHEPFESGKLRSTADDRAS
jgi:hypothetical protein